MTFQLVTLTGHPDFLDLPWQQRLADWQSEHLVEIARGIHRHVVRFVNYDGVLYALKELPEPVAENEYRLLKKLAEHSIPAVEAVGVAKDRLPVLGLTGSPPDELDAVLITRYLDFSLPYRVVFSSFGLAALQDTLLDALAELLVRLHLVGFFWGDCSLSNTLFRRDAGALTAYLVDAETSEIHPAISDGMRTYDLEIAEENVCGGLLDRQASLNLSDEIDPYETAREIRRRYEHLWNELRHEEVFGLDERYLFERRLKRLNSLGFDVKEVELIRTGDAYRLKLETHVVELGHHRRRLLMLTGLHVQENQARRLLNDITAFRAHLEGTQGQVIPESVAAFRWLHEVFEPVISAVPENLRNKLEPAEMFHQVLEHRWFLSELAGKDIGLPEAVSSYLVNVLPYVPDERTMLPTNIDDPG